MTVKFQSFKTAREYVQKLQLKNKREWVSFYKSNKKPQTIPSVPRPRYTEEWKRHTPFDFWNVLNDENNLNC